MKPLLIVGGSSTVTVAVLLVVPVPPSVELIAPVVLLFNPEDVPLTLTVIVQLLLAANAPPLAKLIAVVFCVAVTVPPQALLKPLGVATTRPLGRVSLKAMPESEAVVFGFAIVKVKLPDPLSGMVDDPNALLIVGGATTVILTVS